VGPSYQYIESRCAYGEFGNSVFERMVEWRRAIWLGTDGSGLIRSARVGWTFFSEAQRTRWETTSHPEGVEDLRPFIDLFASGCLGGRGLTLDAFPTDPGQLTAALSQQEHLSIHGIGDLLGEALVPAALRRPRGGPRRGWHAPGADL
jgi:hypothetical protein